MSGQAANEATARAKLPRETEVARSFRVVVTDGPERGKSIVVGAASPAPVLVGTSPACDIVLTDRLVSRRHLSLSRGPLGVHVLDLGSTNGTIVSSLRIVDVTLSGGETLRIGETTLRVELVDGEAPVPLWPTESFGRLLGASATMRRLYELCQKIAASSVPVIIEGETGTGKELLAESLHEMGPRRNHPFVVFDCAALDVRNIEVVLFGEEVRTSGHASETRKGVFEEAAGGTLLIDEIAALPLAVQAKLLRVLERNEICRVGGDEWVRVDARVIATSRQNVDREVELGRFRDDLFFRLATARIELPPLRQREGDATLLAAHFWAQMAEGRPLPVDLTARFDGYAWPGNVRELQHMIARKVALGDSDVRAGAPVPATSTGLDSKAFERVLDLNLSFSEARARVMSEFERYFVERVLAKHGGNVSRAAAASGIARRYFQIVRTRSR